MAQLVCKDLVLGYEGKAVVRNLNFQVEQGDYLCIVGENGSGKSTLIKALLGLKSPMAGEIRTGDGLEADGIGYLPQQTIVQKDFPASVQEIVLSGCLNRFGWHPFYRKEEKALARKHMEKLGITHLAKRCYRELSGGQQQRVLLARALCATKYMLLLDEPVAGLDPLAMQEMYDLLLKLNKEEKITIIMVSHDIQAAATYADHILHISEEPLFFGTRDEYLQSKIGKAYAAVTGGGNHA
jgi:zinc transport system ATP-binding protein